MRACHACVHARARVCLIFVYMCVCVWMCAPACVCLHAGMHACVCSPACVCSWHQYSVTQPTEYLTRSAYDVEMFTVHLVGYAHTHGIDTATYLQVCFPLAA